MKKITLNINKKILQKTIVILAVMSLAATTTVYATLSHVAFEAEAGGSLTNASVINDATASGGSAVGFKLPPTSPTPPTTPTSPSGQPMPVGNLTGWTQVFTDDFTADAPLGSFATVYGTKWRTYSGPDTAGKIWASKKSEYKVAKVLSVNGGVLDKYLHTEYDSAGYNGAGDYMMSAAIIPLISAPQTYGRYTVRLKSDSIDGYKIAWLLWPNSGVWPRDGEIDFAEANLNGVLKAFIHRQNATTGGDQTACTTNPAVYLSSGWHTVTLEWGPTTKIIVDGTVECTSSDRIPNTPMHLVLQTETEINNTRTADKGHLQLDWVAVYTKQL